MTFRGLLLLLASVLITAFSLISFAFGATLLPVDEVQALQDIAQTLGKTDWDFGADPCSRTGGWWDDATEGYEKTVTYDCSFSSGTVCHVISIVQKSQDLPGMLPPELVRLPFLQEIDLTRNYLYGGIPPECGSLGLINISFTVNRLTGPIPIELASISTLVKFTAAPQSVFWSVASKARKPTQYPETTHKLK